MSGASRGGQTGRSSVDIGLVDLLDRVLDAGVVISGDIILSLADIDLVYVNLRVLLGSVDTLFPPAPSGPP